MSQFQNKCVDGGLVYFRLYFTAVLLGSVTLSLAGEQVVLRDGQWRDRRITYRVKANGAFYQGDILIDRVTDASAQTREKSRLPESNVISKPSYRWPGGIVPYELDPQLSSENLAAILDGIKIINGVQAVTLQPRNGEDNYVRFINDDGCYSNVGMVGGAQPISMGTGCESSGTAVHEILHALGGFHDQSRTDRDQYIKVRYENIDKVNASNFDVSADGQDVGFYDYGSLSHYGPRDFTRNGKTAIETIPQGIPIGIEGQGLSPDDIYAVRFMYGKATPGVTITSQPRGQSIIVDGTAITTPAKFDWAQGTQHTVQVPLPQSKEPTARLVAGRWSDDTAPAIKIGNSRTIVVDKTDAIYGYNFVQQFQVSAVVTAAGGGTASLTPASPDGYYTAGTDVSAKAEPSGPKAFLGWTGMAPFGTIGQAANPISYTVTGSTQLRANFGDTAATVIASIPPGRAITVDGEITVTPAPFVWQTGSKHTIGVDAAPQMEYDKILRHVFTGWTDGGAATHEITANGQTITANFTSQYMLITMANPPNGGTIDVSPAAADGWYDRGTTVQITALPALGAQFVQFGGDLTGANPSGAVAMNDQMLITARFAAAAAASSEHHKATQ